MKVSLNIVKQFIDFDLPPVDELVARINAQLGGVENVTSLADKYKDAKIVRVVECEKHPNADRLNVTKIDAGTGELIQVVCGAPNVHADMWAVWLPPASIVPATYGDAEPFTLGARELRGVMSHGMLAAGDELALNDDHEGIIEITDADVMQGKTLVAGASFAEVFGLDDTIIDIENKMFTHRPDCFGQIGVAREIAGILGKQFQYGPEWYWGRQEFKQAHGLSFELENEIAEKVPRFMAVAYKDVTIAPSPLWLQTALVALGGKPINTIVDITNYVMLLTAQPTHAYDYDKLNGGKLVVRWARHNETAELLNGKAYALHQDDIVIADAENVVGVAGIMGGSNSEVSAETRNIVVEVATFDMYAVRKTSMRHGLFTDALTRFNKGQSPLQNERALKLIDELVTTIGQATQASNVIDSVAPAIQTQVNEQTMSGTLQVESDFINQRLGLDLPEKDIEQLLRNVNFACFVDDGTVATSFTAPFWRTDIVDPEDIVEEVGRLYGFDKLPRELPQRRIVPTPKNLEIEAMQRIRNTLARAGASEVLTYSFVHENVLTRAGQDATQAYQVSNALSPDLQYYRLSLVPSLLDKVHMNSKAGYDTFSLFEIGKAHHVDVRDEEGLPKEFGRVAGVYASSQAGDNAPYYVARRHVDYAIQAVLPGAQVDYTRIDAYDVPDFAPFTQALAVFDPVRSAIVEVNGKLAGVVGEFKKSVAKNFKLPAHASGYELFLSPFTQKVDSAYTALSKYPSVERDVCFKVATDVTYAAVYAAATTPIDAITVAVSPIDIYHQADEPTKNITLRLKLTSHEKTLTGDEASHIIDHISAKVIADTKAEII